MSDTRVAFSIALCSTARSHFSFPVCHLTSTSSTNQQLDWFDNTECLKIKYKKTNSHPFNHLVTPRISLPDRASRARKSSIFTVLTSSAISDDCWLKQELCITWNVHFIKSVSQWNWLDPAEYYLKISGIAVIEQSMTWQSTRSNAV